MKFRKMPTLTHMTENIKNKVSIKILVDKTEEIHPQQITLKNILK